MTCVLGLSRCDNHPDEVPATVLLRRHRGSSESARGHVQHRNAGRTGRPRSVCHGKCGHPVISGRLIVLSMDRTQPSVHVTAAPALAHRGGPPAFTDLTPGHTYSLPALGTVPI